MSTNFGSSDAGATVHLSEAAKGLKIGLTTLMAEIARGQLQTCRVEKRGAADYAFAEYGYVRRLEAGGWTLEAESKALMS